MIIQKDPIKTYNSTLYIVPTPIGNLQDITYRALSVLKQVSYIIAENIRRTKFLLDKFYIHTPLYTMNRYNETSKTSVFLEKLRAGHDMALVSDSGTPLINDPGYRLVVSCYHTKKIRIVALPGPCAAITALCGSGLPVDRFCFEGFLPAKRYARINCLNTLLEESRTLIFYDSKHRIIESLKDIMYVFGSERYVVLVREISKMWESIYGAPISDLVSWVQADKTRIQGEMVLIISGYRGQNDKISDKILHVTQLLASELTIKKAVTLVGYIYGIKKNKLYQAYLNKRSSLKD